MHYHSNIILKNNQLLTIRHGEYSDGESVLDYFNKAHSETDYLLTYPEENTFTPEQEAAFLQKKAESENEIEILAFVDEKLAGSAGIESVGNKYKVRHRAEFGISIIKEFWGMGVGRALTEACILCARQAGYSQLELSVVANNERALALYTSIGFTEFGRNPKGFLSRSSGYQELVSMRLDLK